MKPASRRGTDVLITLFLLERHSECAPPYPSFFWNLPASAPRRLKACARKAHTLGTGMEHMRILGTSTILPIALLLATSCAPDSSVGPRSGGLQAPMGPSFTLEETYDNCSWDCHANDATSGDANYYCPQFCHTYPPDHTLRTRIAQALQLVRSDWQCVQLRNFVQVMLSNQAVRYYDMDYWGESGDWHHSRAIDDGGAPDYGGRMHLHWGSTFDLQDLAETLVHEAYHGYFNSSNETEAEQLANWCTGSF